jgi:hypothetical protein
MKLQLGARQLHEPGEYPPERRDRPPGENLLSLKMTRTVTPPPKQPAPKAWAKYLDPKLPAEAFCISGITILFQAADLALRRLVRMHWGAFQVPLSRTKMVHAVFQCSDGSAAPLPRLETWHSFINEHFLLLSDGRRYLLTGYLYEHPWQFHCRSLPDWDPEFVYYYVFEPVLLDLLKRLGVLVWHSAAVARDGLAILLPGVSGSGKSTTTLNLLKVGYQFLADDLVLLRTCGKGLEVAGFETGLYLTERSLELLPEWKKFKRGRRYKRGQRWKYRIDLTNLRPPQGAKNPLAKFLLFPQVTKGKNTRLEKLTESEALLECLRQSPKEYPASILGPSALGGQFEIYSRLVKSRRSYRLRLGADQELLRAVLASL